MTTCNGLKFKWFKLLLQVPRYDYNMYLCERIVQKYKTNDINCLTMLNRCILTTDVGSSFLIN